MSGGAHLPSNMSGGAHLPSNMSGGAHLPSSMGGAHAPSSMSGGAHVPASVHVPGQSGVARTPSATHASEPARGERDRQAGAGPSRTPGPAEHGAQPGGAAHRDGGESERPAARAESAARRPGAPPGVVRVHGRLELAGQVGIHAAPRPYLHPGLRADIARDHAEVDRDRAFVRAHQADFRGRYVRDFDRHELAAWRRGLWRDEWHYGRRGWWWETDGVWYPYDDPMYPYPLEVAPLVVYDTTVVDGPGVPDDSMPPDGAPEQPPGAGPGIAPPGPPGAAAVGPLPAPPAGWYSCSDPAGYYPSVGACSGPWALVQAAPPDAGN
jgi:hypothetical protein